MRASSAFPFNTRETVDTENPVRSEMETIVLFFFMEHFNFYIKCTIFSKKSTIIAKVLNFYYTCTNVCVKYVPQKGPNELLKQH